MISITHEAYEFYALHEMRGYLEDNRIIGPYRFCVERLYQRKTEMLAALICDYLSVVSFGEALHGRSRCHKAQIKTSGRILSSESNMESYPNSRMTVYNEIAKRFNQKQMLEEIVKLFYTPAWRDGFGGESWGKIAKLTLRYLNGEISNTLFIDYSINLHHNGGNVFTKPYLLRDSVGPYGNLNQFLNFRREAKSLFVDNLRSGWMVSFDFYELLLAWHYYNVYPENHYPGIFSYPEIFPWGNDTIEIETKEEACRDDDDDCDDEEESEYPDDKKEEEYVAPKSAKEPICGISAKYFVETIPKSYSTAQIAQFIKEYLIAYPDEYDDSYTRSAYLSQETINHGELGILPVFKSGGYSNGCSCNQCGKFTVALLYTFENEFHEFLRAGKHPKDWIKSVDFGFMTTDGIFEEEFKGVSDGNYYGFI